jgi:transcriptional regulator with XRE-family HTH domain
VTIFGQTLQHLREARRLSQSQLAERVECDHSYISRLEGGTRSPSPEFITRAAGALDLPDEDADALYYAAGFLPQGPTLPPDPIIESLIRALSGDDLPAPAKIWLRQRIRWAIGAADELAMEAA